MPEIQHQIGIHDVTWAPQNTFYHPRDIGKEVTELGADFWVHMPNWRDLVVSDITFRQLNVKPKIIDSSWWEDRAVEITTPLTSPVSVPEQAINVAKSTAYPTPPFAKSLTQRELRIFPNASLARRWPIYESGDITPKLDKRNNILRVVSPEVSPTREILDIHSTNLDLTPQQILDWQSQKKGRRLMFSALAVDERLDKYNMDPKDQHDLVSPLIPYASVVTLKIEAVKDETGKVLMNSDKVISSILNQNTDNEYARRIKRLSQIVGTKSEQPTIDWVIKIKSSKNNSLAPKFVEYIKKIIK